MTDELPQFDRRRNLPIAVRRSAGVFRSSGPSRMHETRKWAIHIRSTQTSGFYRRVEDSIPTGATGLIFNEGPCDPMEMTFAAVVDTSFVLANSIGERYPSRIISAKPIHSKIGASISR